MSGWWRRNGIALAALVALVPVTGLVILQQERTETANAFGEFPVTVGAGAPLELEGVRLGPAVAGFVAVDQAPRGARVLEVTLPVDTRGSELSCLPPVLREATGEGREWRESSGDLGLGYRSDRYSSCAIDAGPRYAMTLWYLVPEDATGPFFVDVSWADLLPRFARLPVSG